ncbi:STAS domain-containing protein [Balneolales bacterium ANBcel1]|nr:STAS domain-containing protein [Balneolales bacterium ANBcel1]
MSTFEIKRRSESNIVILDIFGELDAHTAPVLEKEFQQLIEDKSVEIIVNGSSLEYISSAGLGVFMAYIEDIRSQGGDIKITRLKPKVFNVFDLLGFPTLYDILDTEADAIDRFQNRSQ